MRRTPATRAEEAKTMAAVLAPSTMLRTLSSREQETREEAGLRPKAEVRDTGRALWDLSSLEEEAREAETLHPTEATEAAIAEDFV
jgi:hypothetical protein